MLSFYYVDKEYASYLRQFDSKVPSLDYDNHNKFFCGIVLNVNNIKYYVPVSHDITKQQTSLIIYDKGRGISSLKFAFMIPVPNSKITRIDFNQIAKKDSKYADLLRAEYYYCSSHEAEILKKAKSVYKIGCNQKHKLHGVCCKFPLLEEKLEDYNLLS